MVEDLASLRMKVENEIKSCLAMGGSPVFGLSAMNAYHMGFADRDGKPISASKGKYLRPIFCLAMCGGMHGDIDQALPAAASLEIVHRTSLIFDDIQDVGKERNGQPTVWTIWGKNQAINAGLALSCYARLAVQRGYDRGIAPENILTILNVLEHAVDDLCWGQYYDLSSVGTLNAGVEDYFRMVRGKTAALFGAACEIGAICAGALGARREAAKLLGINLGIAFQIHDDYLGIWGDEDQVGKTANDLIEKKMALPLVLTLSKYPEEVNRWLHFAKITPKTAHMMKDWMTNHGIADDVKYIEAKCIRAAEEGLKALGLRDEWDAQFKLVMAFLSQRNI